MVTTNAISCTELDLMEMGRINGGGLLDYLRRKTTEFGAWVYRNKDDIKAHTIGIITSFFSNAHVGKYMKDEYKKKHR